MDRFNEDKREEPLSAGGAALRPPSRALPALQRAQQVSDQAAGVGFDWPDAAAVRKKVDEELAELDEAMGDGDPAAIAEELGDLLFTLVNLGRHLPLGQGGAEEVLQDAIDKFVDRFQRVERALLAEGRSVRDAAPEDLEARWRLLKD